MSVKEDVDALVEAATTLRVRLQAERQTLIDHDALDVRLHCGYSTDMSKRLASTRPYRNPAQRIRDAAERSRRSPVLARVAAAGERGLRLFGALESADATDCYEHGLLSEDDGVWRLTDAGRAAIKA